MSDLEQRLANAVADGVLDAEDVATLFAFARFLPTAQLYYWTRAWQENERAAVAELEQGEHRRFDTPHDAVRWLES